MGNCIECLKVACRKETPGRNSAPPPPCCVCPKFVTQQMRCPECCRIPKRFQDCLGIEVVKRNPLEPPPIKLPGFHFKSPGELAFPRKDHKYPIIWLLGGPSSGRRTQGRMLGAHYNYMYIRWETLLSSQLPLGASHHVRLLRSDEKLNRPPKDYMDQVKAEMCRGMYLYQGFFIQGCPYNVEDAHEFIKMVGDVFMILHFDVNMADRLARSEGFGEIERLNRYHSREGKEQFKKDLDQWQNSTQHILTAFQHRVIKLNSSESTDMIYARAVNCIDYVLRKTGLRVPPPSKDHKKRRVKNSLLTVINDVEANSEHVAPPIAEAIPIPPEELATMGRFSADPPPNVEPVGSDAFHTVDSFLND